MDDPIKTFTKLFDSATDDLTQQFVGKNPLFVAGFVAGVTWYINYTMNVLAETKKILESV